MDATTPAGDDRPEARFFVVHGLRDPSDPEGRTYKQANLARQHAIPIGALVEITGDVDWPDLDGTRLYVVCHLRDCDGTPLYALCADRTVTERESPHHANRKWHHGIAEGRLTLVRPTA